MGLHPGTWLDLKFKPANRAQRRIENFAHDSVSGVARRVLIGPNTLVAIRSQIEDEIEGAARND